MDLSILTAKILALTYLAAGIAALTGKLTFSKIVEDFERSAGLTFVTGFITLILGMLLVNYHNIWVKNWTLLITLIGWTALIKGLWLIAFPRSISRFKNYYKNTRAWGILMLAIGSLFAYFGFWI